MNIYVANIAHSVTEEMLKNVFQEHGQVRSVKIIKDQLTGEPRGFAFVEMSSTAEGKAAIEALNNYELSGRKLSVNEARPRDPNSRPSNGGSRGGFGNGGRRDDKGGYSRNRG